MNKEYTDEVGYKGTCALIYAILSSEEVTVQVALDRFGITPYIDPELLRR